MIGENRLPIDHPAFREPVGPPAFGTPEAVVFDEAGNVVGRNAPPGARTLSPLALVVLGLALVVVMR